jgi:XTP/dITP diphosphohydrolase
MTRLCIGTTNRGKQRELLELLGDWPGEIVFPQQLGLALEVAETGQTFAENAAQKARAYARAAGMPALADDSGLEVDALGGAPGVQSARYAGPGASDEDRYRKLLAELEGVPLERRTARFRCAVAVAHPDGRVAIAEGTCEGRIAFAPRGRNGFGYDPVFLVSGRGMTMAELPPEIKNQISHRARALRAARPLLDALLEAEEGQL